MDDRHTPTFLPLRLRLQPGNHVIDLAAPDILLGRQSDADLRMPQPDVSRQHCRFQFADGDWRVVDLDSLNGVYINGARVSRMAVIHAGDLIRICGIEFDVEVPTGDASADESSGKVRDTTAAVPHPTFLRKAS
jgi:pSer/pThr/pTyr-binding forkhead associated (FHA) protein